jgi:hypothetical protein
MSDGARHRLLRWLAVPVLLAAIVGSLRVFDRQPELAQRQERLYFPSGRFLRESALGFRETMADFLWFRFVQYYGAFAKDQNDLRYFDVVLDGITRLDPRFVEAYFFASLVRLSDFADIEGSLDWLRRGILHNPDNAKLKFQIGFINYVILRNYPLAAHWFETASRCSDASDRERRFAAFARHRAGDDRVSLELWRHLYGSTDSPQMKALAEKMILKLQRKLELIQSYGEGFIGPIPEV